MEIIVSVEIVSAAFLMLLLWGQIRQREHTQSGKYLKLCTLLVLFSLVTDVLAYLCTDASTPFIFRYVICLFAYANGSIVFFGFSYYSESIFREKTECSPWLFRIYRLLLLLWFSVTAAEFFAGNIIVYENGVEAADYGFPQWLVWYQAAVALYTPVLALVYRKRIGNETVLLLSVFNMTPILGILSNFVMKKDYTFVFAAFTLVLITEILQRNESRARERELAEKELLLENNARLFALEDTFESLYDVDLDTGSYEVYVKGDFYKNNVINKLSVSRNYFEDLKSNIESVIFEEDREGLYIAASRESIQKELSEKDHFDYYYRINTDKGPEWFKMRMVYKDQTRKNAIIGVFNAEEDVGAKQLEENMQMIGGLADRYDTLYYVNLSEGIFRIYALDAEKFPLTKDVISGISDPFEALKLFGNSPIVYPDDHHLFDALSAETVMEKLAHQKKFSMRYRQADGGDFVWFEMEVVKFEDKDSPANALAIGFYNCDSEIRAEQEYRQKLEDALDAADAANRAKSNFLFNMSHDIRTPMNAIKGFTAMAKKHIDEKEKVTDFLNKIDISGQQLLTMINEVLEMSRIESGKLVLDEDRVNVRDEFNSMVTVLAEQAKANGLRFSYSFTDVEHDRVLADRARMGSITYNIAGNAMKYTPEGGSVTMGVREIPCEREGYAAFVFTVSDTGIGMSEEFLKEIYEPFSREKNSTVSKIQGTGLGMSIVKSVVDLMGGTINVDSKPGEGTRFDITVDFRIDESAEEKKEEDEKVKTGSLRGCRVLLVDDNELNREIANDILSDEGLAVEEADDGTAAVETVREKGPDYYDFILMDIQMPVMNGYEATREIRNMYPEKHIPIIALSANAFAEDRNASLAAGMDDHVAKPIDIRTLFGVLAKFILNVV